MGGHRFFIIRQPPHQHQPASQPPSFLAIVRPVALCDLSNTTTLFCRSLPFQNSTIINTHPSFPFHTHPTTLFILSLLPPSCIAAPPLGTERRNNKYTSLAHEGSSTIGSRSTARGGGGCCSLTCAQKKQLTPTHTHYQPTACDLIKCVPGSKASLPLAVVAISAIASRSSK